MRDELRVAATIENVRRISSFVRDAGRRMQVPADALYDIDLAVEEASTNIARHAYAPGQSGDLEVRIEDTEEAIRITLTDWGRPFDADASHLEVDVPIEERAEGGMGLLLIYKLMDEVGRTTASTPGEPNVLTLVKHIGRSA